MVDVKYPVSGSIRMWWLPANGLANPKSPKASEVAAGLDISDAVSWNDKDFGVNTSNTTSDPAITATGNTKNRGAAQYGGSLSFYYPAVFGDNSNLYSLVWDALHLPGTAGYLVVRVDGLEKKQAVGDATGPGWEPAAGDMVTVYRVETGGYSEQITGEEAFRYTISFLPKGLVAPWVILAGAAPTKPVVSGASSVAVAAKTVLTAKGGTRDITRGVTWKSSNPAVATVSANGVVVGVTAGPATITATDKATNEVSTAFSITVGP